MSMFKNPFKKNSISSEKQETGSPKFISPSSRQPVDTQLDMGTPTVETGGSLFDGMDFDDVTPETKPISQDESLQLCESALPLDIKFEAIESRVTRLTERCQLQERRGQLNQLIGEAEQEEDFTTAEKLNAELEAAERELRQCDVRTDLLDVWNGFYSQVMEGYKREAERLQEMSGVRQDAADRLQQDARREEQEYTRQTEEQRRELSLLVERQDHSKRQLRLDKEHVQRQQQILEDDVTSRTSQLVLERTQLETRVEGLDQEIRELERQLSRLKSNREESLSDLRQVEERLGAVYESVADEKSRLEQEATQVETAERELETQDKEIVHRRDCFSALEERHKVASKVLRDKIEKLEHAPLLVDRIYSLEKEPKGYQEELESVLFTQLEEAQTSKLNVTVATLSADIDHLSACSRECQEELKGLEWNLGKGEDKIRQLDSVKKGLTQVKKYKEAREAAEERKKVSEKQEQLRLDIESKTEDNSELSKQFEEKCSELQAARVELALAEQQGDTNIFKCLLELTNNLKKDEQLEKWDPKRELIGYKLKVFELYRREICIKHGWEYTSPGSDYSGREETVDNCLDAEATEVSKQVDMEQTTPEMPGDSIDNKVANTTDD